MADTLLTGMDLIHEAEKLLAPVSAKYTTKPEHWIHDWDEGLSFCRECAEKKITELLAEEPDADYVLDGGWGSEGDSQAFCETCQCALGNSFTTYACENELAYLEEHGIDVNDPGDCHSFCEIVMAEGCESSELFSRIEAIARQAIEKLGI